MDPVTATLVMGGISAVASFAGSVARAGSAAAAARHRARVGKMQADYYREQGKEDAAEIRQRVKEDKQITDLTLKEYELQAGMARSDAARAARDYRQEGVRTHATQRLAFARSGVRMVGSPVSRLTETVGRITEGSRRIIERGERAATGAERAATGVRLRQKLGEDRAERAAKRTEKRSERQAELAELGGSLGPDPFAAFLGELPNIAQAGLNLYQGISGALKASAQPMSYPAGNPRTPFGFDTRQQMLPNYANQADGIFF